MVQTFCPKVSRGHTPMVRGNLVTLSDEFEKRKTAESVCKSLGHSETFKYSRGLHVDPPPSTMYG